ncbi:MAG TPA: hypothetical protein VEZ72_08910 [Paenibacillus sp.]|nr:hypothetical protein [Paenibacillus sp.]
MALRYREGERGTLRAMKASDEVFRAFDDDVSRGLDGVHGPTSDAKYQSRFEQQQKTRFDDSLRLIAEDKEGVPVGTNGEFHDELHYGMTKDEFVARYGAAR